MDLPTTRVLHMRGGEQVNAADALCIALTRLTAQTYRLEGTRVACDQAVLEDGGGNGNEYQNSR